MVDSSKPTADRSWVLLGETEPYSRDALDLMVMDGLIELQDQVEPAGGGQPITVGEVLGILPALPVSERLDALAEGLELPEGQTIDTMKSDELPRVVSMIPRVDTMPVSKPKSTPILTPQRLGIVVSLVLGLGIVGFLLMPRGEDRERERAAQQSDTDGVVADPAVKVVSVQRPAEQLLRPGQKRLTVEDKQGVLESELEDLESCLPDKAKDSIKIQFKIKPNGAPFAIRLDTEDTSVNACVRAKVFRWRFPRFSGPSDALAFRLGGPG